MFSRDQGKGPDQVVILVLLALFMFASPLVRWLMSSEHPWYLPYLIWLSIILLGALLQRRRGRHEL